MSRAISAKAADVRLQHIMQRRQVRANKVRESLATGAKINRAADDAAGLAVSSVFKHRTKALGSARINANEALSFMQTKEAFMGELNGTLDRIRKLAVQASTSTTSDEERSVMTVELNALKNSFSETLEKTYNTKRLFAQHTGIPFPAGSQDISFQVGIDHGRFASVNTITLEADAIKQIWSLYKTKMNVSTADKAQTTLTAVDKGLNRLNQARSGLAATYVRVESAVQNIHTSIENNTASESRIRDADFAEETSRLTRLDIASQTTIALISQVNDVRKVALQLL